MRAGYPWIPPLGFSGLEVQGFRVKGLELRV